MADWKYNPYVALALLLVIIVVIAYQLAVRRQTGSEEVFTKVLICNSSNHKDEKTRVFEAEIGKNDKPPYLCPVCGEKTAYRALKCYNPDCGQISPILDKEIRCHLCGSTHAKPVDRLEELNY